MARGSESIFWYKTLCLSLPIPRHQQSEHRARPLNARACRCDRLAPQIMSQSINTRPETPCLVSLFTTSCADLHMRPASRICIRFCTILDKYLSLMEQIYCVCSPTGTYQSSEHSYESVRERSSGCWDDKLKNISRPFLA